jgi:hypothetical protein
LKYSSFWFNGSIDSLASSFNFMSRITLLVVERPINSSINLDGWLQALPYATALHSLKLDVAVVSKAPEVPSTLFSKCATLATLEIKNLQHD